MSDIPFEFVVREGAEKGRRIAVPAERFSIGSGQQCALRFPANLVREVHAEVHRDAEGDFQLEDKTGANLTWVDGRVVPKAPLQSGSIVRLGRLELQFVSVDETISPHGLGEMTLESPDRKPAPHLESRQRSNEGLAALKATPLGNSMVGHPSPKPTRVADSDPSASGRFTPGDLIQGRYRIVARIAAGGMGEVYKVEHVELGKALAMKVMLPSLNADQEFVNRFKIEAVAASRIGHPNIIDISDFGSTTDGRFFFVMEFLDGVTLSSLVHRQGQQSPPRAVALVLQAARALAAAHELHIVHRDLKPDNIMVLQRPGNPDLVKVLDFGVARVKVDDESIGKTVAGVVVGTPQYMSPEQAKAIPVDARSDIYSLGLILHELLGGKPTFTGETPPIVMVKQVTEPPPPLPDYVPEDLQALVFAMLEKEPDARPQAMKEVVAQLDVVRAAIRTSDFPSAVGNSTVVQAPTPPPTKSGRRSGASSPHKTKTPARISSKPGTLARHAEPAAKVLDVEPSAPSVATESEELELAGLAPKSSKLPLVIVGVLVLMLVGGGAVLLGATSPKTEPVQVVKVIPSQQLDPEKPATPPPPVEPKPVQLLLESTPPGAEVSEKGVVLGNTPLSLSRAPGTVVEVSVALAGYRPASRKLLVSADVPSLSISLEALAKKVEPKPVEPKPEPRPDEKPEPKPVGKKPEPKSPGLKPPPPELDLKPAPF